MSPHPPESLHQRGKEAHHGQVIAGITTSVNGYVAAPDDGPGNGLGTGGEPLHNWVFGGPAGTGRGAVDVLTIIVSPVVLGGGKRLFDGFDKSLHLEHLDVRQSPLATFVDYRVLRS